MSEYCSKHSPDGISYLFANCPYCHIEQLTARVALLERELEFERNRGAKNDKMHDDIIEALQAENQRLCKEIEFDKALDTKIIKDQARKEGRMEAARECYIIAQNILVRAMKCDNFIGNAMDDLLDEIKDKFGLR